MITTDKDFENLPTKDHPRVYYGKNTDTKPTANVMNGAAFIDIDKGDVYFFDKETGTWKGDAE